MWKPKCGLLLMSDWIECNLMWDYIEPFVHYGDPTWFTYDKWKALSPTEQSELNKQAILHNEAARSKTFCGQGLNKPGTLVEIANKGIFLIGGHVESAEPCCNLDSYLTYSPDTIVKRYKKLEL